MPVTSADSPAPPPPHNTIFRNPPSQKPAFSFADYSGFYFLIRIYYFVSGFNRFQADHMLKQSASRNQRAKGFKVKHAIQISVLLLVCVWLLYQLKQSFMSNYPAIEVSFLGTTEGVSFLGRKGLIDSQVKEGNDEEQEVEKVEEEEPEQLEDLIDEDDKDERIGKVIGLQV